MTNHPPICLLEGFGALTTGPPTFEIICSTLVTVLFVDYLSVGDHDSCHFDEDTVARLCQQLETTLVVGNATTPTKNEDCPPAVNIWPMILCIIVFVTNILLTVYAIFFLRRLIRLLNVYPLKIPQ